MPRPVSILLAAAGAAAAALLASGCEYWRNLTQEIVPDQAAVTLTVRDALTGEPLPDAGCGKQGQQTFRADGNGVIARDDMPTGIYVLVCEAPFYRPREQRFELRLGETRSDTVWLVRKGGKDWYPGVDHRKVEIQFLKENDRFPGTLVVKALPDDGSGRFLYEWSSNLHEVPSESPASICTLHTPASQLDSQTLNLGLKVRFKPVNEAPYLIDSIVLQRKLVRNLPPTISLDDSIIEGEYFRPNVVVGCGANPDVLSVLYTAGDPDGVLGCQIRVTNTDPDKPIGLIDTLLPCGRGKFEFMVKSHLGAASTAVKILSELKFEVKDLNGETQSTSLKLETVANIQPSIEMKLGPKLPYVFTTTQVLCTLYVDDGEGAALDKVTVDWGNGVLQARSVRNELPPHMTIFNGIFKDTGAFTIKARIDDRCNGSAEAKEEIEVRRNSMPVFSVVDAKPLDPVTKDFRLQVGVVDVDLDNKLDSVKLLVQWNKDGDPNDISVYDIKSNDPAGQVLTHHYDPSRPESQFKIFLQAFDQHDNRKDTTLIVPRAEAVWDLSPPPSPPPGPISP